MIIIQDDMPFAYYLTKIVNKRIKEYTGTPLSRSEITTFTIFFNNIITDHTDHRKKYYLLIVWEILLPIIIQIC